MSLLMHAVVLGLLIVDLIVGATVVDRFAGRWAAIAFEFALIFGYVLLILRVGAPWGRRGDDDR